MLIEEKAPLRSVWGAGGILCAERLHYRRQMLPGGLDKVVFVFPVQNFVEVFVADCLMPRHFSEFSFPIIVIEVEHRFELIGKGWPVNTFGPAGKLIKMAECLCGTAFGPDLVVYHLSGPGVRPNVIDDIRDHAHLCVTDVRYQALDIPPRETTIEFLLPTGKSLMGESILQGVKCYAELNRIFGSLDQRSRPGAVRIHHPTIVPWDKVKRHQH